VPLSIEPFDPPTAKIEGPHYILAMGTANRDYRTLLTAVSPLNIRTIIIAGKHALAGLEIPSQVEIYHDLTLAQCHAFAQSARINVIPIADETAASGQVTMLETMLLGRPVIATDCAGTRDYLIPENNALLVPPQDAPALRREIERLWNDPERGDMLGENGRLFVRTNALVSAVASRMAEILIKAGEVRHPRR
jgi:glycosyltransferase involved in cell wall biosynthesis